MMIPRTPQLPPATSPHDARYYDERDLEAELRRTFQICHECRMCVSYCGSFPELFARVDRDIDSGRAEGAEKIDDAGIRAVSEACWQCKLCYIKCPYTADEGASELLDFPRLMAREKAARARREGVPLVDRVLGEPQLMGRLASGRAAKAANLINASRLLRKGQEKATGVSAEFPLPRFAEEPFPQWFARHEPGEHAGEAGRVVLFATCTGNYNAPAIPSAAVRVLERLGYEVLRVQETCCGMPNLDGGDVARCADKIRQNVAALLPQVRAGDKVLVAQPTCAYTIKREWPEYVPADDVRAVAAATRDLMEFLDQLRRERGLPAAERGLGAIAYHAACHLRAQKIGVPGARLLQKALPDTEVRIVAECSAVDGTWGMKAKNYETGRRYAHKLCDEAARGEPDLLMSDCHLSALRLQHETGRPVLHPVQGLARAWNLEDS